jgi:transcriptional regulator with XRE-family HTH domain
MSSTRSNDGRTEAASDPTGGARPDPKRAREMHGAFSNLFKEDEDAAPQSSAGNGNGEVAEDLRAIANRVRRWREEAGMTLQELARRSGVAGSTIQKVESLQMIPTLGVVLKIARGLDRAPSELVRDGGDELEVVHLRPDERHRIGGPGFAHHERMVGDLFEPQLEAWRITLEPGHGSGRGRIRFDGEGIIFCEAGALSVGMGEETFRLGEGDVLHYKTTLPHGWRNEGDVPARLLIVGTLPRALRSALRQRMRGGREPDDRSS